MKFDIDTFEFTFGNVILEEIKILDAILEELGEPAIFENPKFKLDHKSASSLYLRLSLVRDESRNIVPLVIHCEGDGIHIDVFLQSEVKDWSIEELRSDRGQFSHLISDLLTCYLVKESSSALFGGCRLLFYNQDGIFVRKFILSGSDRFFFNRSCERELFLPVFPSEMP
ncbi:MAG: hypothetical protein OEM82_10865 [Acidobacteriota bacterium]|nr:hypothetical protein [Acidobacteriota bacterium]MDH3530297.1 hypothetical protein [Acidobacteriota bacterium]